MYADENHLIDVGLDTTKLKILEYTLGQWHHKIPVAAAPTLLSEATAHVICKRTRLGCLQHCTIRFGGGGSVYWK